MVRRLVKPSDIARGRITFPSRQIIKDKTEFAKKFQDTWVDATAEGEYVTVAFSTNSPGDKPRKIKGVERDILSELYRRALTTRGQTLEEIAETVVGIFIQEWEQDAKGSVVKYLLSETQLSNVTNYFVASMHYADHEHTYYGQQPDTKPGTAPRRLRQRRQHV